MGRRNSLFSFDTTRTQQKTKKKRDWGTQLHREEGDLIGLLTKIWGVNTDKEQGDLISIRI
jgi:hypothetical protein